MLQSNYIYVHSSTAESNTATIKLFIGHEAHITLGTAPGEVQSDWCTLLMFYFFMKYMSFSGYYHYYYLEHSLPFIRNLIGQFQDKVAKF